MSNVYEIIIRNDTEEQSSPVAGQNQTSSGRISTAPSGNANTKNSKNLPFAYVAYSRVAPYVNNYVSHKLNMVHIQTGANEFSARIQEAWSFASATIEVAADTAIGLYMGQGPGAVVGFAVGVAKQGISLAQRTQTLQMEKTVESVSLDIARRRAGVSGSR